MFSQWGAAVVFDFWSRFRDEALVHDQLAKHIAENTELHAENERLRTRIEELEWALDLCQMAASAGLNPGNGVDETEDGDEAPGT